jgi:hypothetical protein
MVDGGEQVLTDTAFDPASSPPVPQSTELTAFYWDAVAQGRLELLRCQSCGHFVHFPRAACDACQGRDLRPEQISGRGTLYTYSVIMQASHPYFVGKIPYIIGIVSIDEEPAVHLPTGIVDAQESELRCGLPVEVVFREVNDSLTLPFFRLAR